MGQSNISQPKVLLVGEIEDAHEDWEAVKQACEVVQYSSGDREDFLRSCRTGSFDGFTAICRSNQYTHLTGNLDETVVEALPKSLQYICNIGSGVNSIDIEACKSRGIQVSNTPALAAAGVAETVMFLIFGVLRRAAIPLSTARKGEWQHNCPTGTGMMHKTLGLIGSGDTASAVAYRAAAFGMKVQYCSHNFKTPDNSLQKCLKSTFDNLIQTSDIISLHVPLTASTRHMLSKHDFGVMKPGIVIIKTARGEVIDNAALFQAVEDGKVWGAGMDVYDEEPYIPVEMREDERFFILPHIATRTHEIRESMEKVAIENLRAGVLKQDGHSGLTNSL